ncbi:hypothetical protein HDU96_008614 [Phlyctochytrium bullatum]|nr:hypothetical protein HDU96_008614 [Phlyctochytrium bullatum]
MDSWDRAVAEAKTAKAQRRDLEKVVEAAKVKLEEKRLDLEIAIKEKEVKAKFVKDLVMSNRSMGEIEELVKELFP